MTIVFLNISNRKLRFVFHFIEIIYSMFDLFNVLLVKFIDIEIYFYYLIFELNIKAVDQKKNPKKQQQQQYILFTEFTNNNKNTEMIK